MNSQLASPRHALIQGASRGIGLGLVRRLLDNPRVEQVIATSRHPEKSEGLRALRDAHSTRLELLALDVTRPESVEAAALKVKERLGSLHLLFNVSGVLHNASAGIVPEKSLRDIEPERLAYSFAVNAIGPMVMARYFHGLFRHGEPAVWANMSARVGSIGDNHLGGWYGYRASKAALNQFTRTLSIEMARKAPQTICVLLHPGTVATDLSAPFTGSRTRHRVFEVDEAADQLLEVIDALTEADHGGFLDWAGQVIPW